MTPGALRRVAGRDDLVIRLARGAAAPMGARRPHLGPSLAPRSTLKRLEILLEPFLALPLLFSQGG